MAQRPKLLFKIYIETSWRRGQWMAAFAHLIRIGWSKRHRSWFAKGPDGELVKA